MQLKLIANSLIYTIIWFNHIYTRTRKNQGDLTLFLSMQDVTMYGTFKKYKISKSIYVNQNH